MKPIAGRAGANGASGFNIISATLDLSPAAATLLPDKGCTTTFPNTYGFGDCAWDSTYTIYPSTAIRYKSVDCRGCDHVVVDAIHFCPNRIISATKRASTASTFWSTVCEPSRGPVLNDVEVRAPATTTVSEPLGTLAPAAAPSPVITTAPKATAALGARQGAGLELLACPTTKLVQPEMSAGKTKTTYARYTTTTIYVACGGCPLVVSTALAGYGPPVTFTKTTTLPVGTRTAYACS